MSGILTLDTTAYSALDRGDPEVRQHIAHASGLIVPAVVVAELLFGFKNGSREALNTQRLQRFLAQGHSSVGFIDNYELIKLYSKLQQYAKRSGRALSNNDIWIAAITQLSSTTLLTHDKDFAVFAPLMEDRLVLLKPE